MTPWTAGWEEVPLGGGLQHLHLFRLRFRLGSSEPHSNVPQDLGHVSLSPPDSQVLPFQEASVASVQWATWDSTWG